MRAESSLLYPNHESRNNGLRSPEETQRTINALLAELTRQKQSIQDAQEQIIGLGAALDEALRRISALETENARLREAR